MSDYLPQVEVAFGIDPLDYASLDDPSNWTVVDVRGFTYRTSTRSDRFGGFSAGNATIQLDNTGGEYDPNNSGSTYAGELVRGVPVRIVSAPVAVGTASYQQTGGTIGGVGPVDDVWTSTGHGLNTPTSQGIGGQRVIFTAAGSGASGYSADTTYYTVGEPSANEFRLSATDGGSVISGTGDGSGWSLARVDTLWYGYAKSWKPATSFPDESVTTLTCIDGLGVLAQYYLEPITDGSGNLVDSYDRDTAGERIDRVLDDIGWPDTYRHVGVGPEIIATHWGENALQHCQNVAKSATGFFYAQRDGVLVFDDTAALTTFWQSTIQDTVGHNAAPTPLNDGSFDQSSTGDGYITKATISRVGGEPQTVDNTGSNQIPVSYQQTGLLLSEDGQALAAAQFYADLYGTDTPYTPRVRFAVATVNEAVNAVIQQRWLRDRVKVEAELPGNSTAIGHECFIDGIAGTLANGALTIEWTMSSADAYDDNLASAPDTWFVLNDSTLKLGVGKLGY